VVDFGFAKKISFKSYTLCGTSEVSVCVCVRERERVRTCKCECVGHVFRFGLFQ
jgi:hypothetical protein